MAEPTLTDQQAERAAKRQRVLWVCPKCNSTQMAIALSVEHRCPSNQRKRTVFKPQYTALQKRRLAKIGEL